MLTGFMTSFVMIGMSELGDKTFFIAALLAMRHSRRWVFCGAVSALALMTVLSVLVGQVATLLPHIFVKWIAAILFALFGLKLLLQASQMPATRIGSEEQEATVAVARAEQLLTKKKWQKSPLTIATEAFGLTFAAEWGDRTQLATITLAAANNPMGVVLGAILGHAMCAAIATSCGRLICKWISERTLTAVSGLLFLIFAVFEVLYSIVLSK